MNLSDVLDSKSQRRFFVTTSLLILGFGSLILYLLAKNVPPTPVSNAFIGLFASITASGAFALISGFYIWFLFHDPKNSLSRSKVHPKDIKSSIREIAGEAREYRIWVRTGRHFRSEVLPELVRMGIERRSATRLAIILLDFRDEQVCRWYSDYRASSSFDRHRWSEEYVKSEVLATLQAVLDAMAKHPGAISADIYLSKRLSTFRIEGSQTALIVTREDPKEPAAKYSADQRAYDAYSAELDWVQREADRVVKSDADTQPKGILELFPGVVTDALVLSSSKLIHAGSPYV